MPNKHSKILRFPKSDASAPPAKNARSNATATQLIAHSITNAIIEHRLAPGTKLAEQQIADVFKVSRTLVRQALIQMSRDHLIILEPGRGARVAKPSVEEVHQVFEVRCMFERSMIERAAEVLTPAQIGQLREHLRTEALAVKNVDIKGRTRLLADFHVLIAEMLGNSVLTGMLVDLVSRCSLITLMYQSEHSAGHSFEEHIAIVDALENRNPRAAIKLMISHLQNVERNLQLDPRIRDLKSALLDD
jgi:DNA-binding GntR family transcriptional regulator